MNATKCVCELGVLFVFAHIILTFNNYYLNKRLLQKISGIRLNDEVARTGLEYVYSVWLGNVLLLVWLKMRGREWYHVVYNLISW